MNFFCSSGCIMPHMGVGFAVIFTGTRIYYSCGCAGRYREPNFLCYLLGLSFGGKGVAALLKNWSHSMLITLFIAI